jgi:hypothetical protein
LAPAHPSFKLSAQRGLAHTGRRDRPQALTTLQGIQGDCPKKL